MGPSNRRASQRLTVDCEELKKLTVKFDSFEEAVHKCDDLNITPVFMGPSPFTDDSGGACLNVGDDVSEYQYA